MPHGFAENLQRSAIGPERAGDDFDQGGHTRAIFAEEGMDKCAHHTGMHSKRRTVGSTMGVFPPQIPFALPSAIGWKRVSISPPTPSWPGASRLLTLLQ
jgi:hypothetical protein